MTGGGSYAETYRLIYPHSFLFAKSIGFGFVGSQICWKNDGNTVLPQLLDVEGFVTGCHAVRRERNNITASPGKVIRAVNVSGMCFKKPLLKKPTTCELSKSTGERNKSCRREELCGGLLTQGVYYEPEEEDSSEHWDHEDKSNYEHSEKKNSSEHSDNEDDDDDDDDVTLFRSFLSRDTPTRRVKK